MPAMLGCNTVCPRCRHEFRCCPPPNSIETSTSCCARRALNVLSGGGLVQLGSDCTMPVTSILPQLQPLPPSPLSLCPPRSPPQASPSVPLTFVLPPPPPILLVGIRTDQLTVPVQQKPEADMERLQNGVRLLKLSGWYHEGLTWQQSQEILKNTPAGTFLIRDSSDQRFLYSLSVQTEQGPTSVRLHYVDGRFRLDSEPHLAPFMPLFNTVLDLIVHYVRCSRSADNGTRSTGGGGQVWVDSKGCMFSRILLKRPLYRADEVPSLKHLARIAVHAAIEKSSVPKLPLLPVPHKRLDLPPSLVEYLSEYPYSM